MKTVIIQLIANQQTEIGINGNFVSVVSASGPIKITTAKGASLILQQGQSVEMAVFDVLRIEEKSGDSQTVTLAVGNGRFEDNRFSGSIQGVVETAPDYSRSISGKGFLIWMDHGAVVGNYSICKIENPAGSGKNLVIPELYINGSAGGTVFLGWNAATGTLTDAIKNLMVGQPDSVAKSSGEHQTAMPSPDGYWLGLFTTGTPIKMPLYNPLILPPDKQLWSYNTVGNSSVGIGFSYFEEAL